MHQRSILIVPLLGLTACGAMPAAPVAGIAHRHVLAAAPADAAPGVEAPASVQALAVTVYHDALALVADTRRVALPAGTVTLRFPGVISQLDGSSVRLWAPAGVPAPDVREQSFNPNGLTAAALLQAFVGRTVHVRLPAEGATPSKTVPATLLNTDGPMVRIGDRVYLKPPGDLVLPDVPPGLAASPTLTWRLVTPQAYSGNLTAGYLTRGLSWQADYTLTLDADATHAAVAGWATLNNQSGTTLPDARLMVVAGALNRRRAIPFAEMRAYAAPAPTADGVSTAPVGEFYRYSFAERVTLPDQQTKQLKLLSDAALPVVKRLRFESATGQVDDTPRSARTSLSFKNDAAGGLGVPLPAGRARVYQNGALVGEDSVSNTPANEAVKLQLGEAFDVVGQHKQLSVTRPSEHQRDEAYSVTVRNHKAAEVALDVVEQPYGAWTVTAHSAPYTIASANELVFPVRVPAHGEVTVTYSLRYRE